MIPLRDNIPSRSTPIVNYLILASCTLVFLAQLSQREQKGTLFERYGMIPVRVFHPDKPVNVADVRLVQTPIGIALEQFVRPAAESSVPPWLTLLTCTFLHGGWMHFLGNMWFLYIFGDNVEDRFGHLGYLLFYLGCGVAASAAHLVVNANNTTPTIGASGAIAGVMGAYLLLYPRARVLTLVPIFIFIHIMMLPAPVFLVIWFFIQFYHGTAAITSMQSTGVAWWAHIGGFIVGFLVAWQLRQRHRLRPAVTQVLPHTDRIRSYRIRRDPGRRGW